jgi:uncharacterized membrane protein YuzA (DUF378 family)
MVCGGKMMNKNTLFFTLGILIGMFLLPGILEWLGLPSFANVLTKIFGEPNAINRVVVGLLGVLIIFFFIKVFLKKKEG